MVSAAAQLVLAVASMVMQQRVRVAPTSGRTTGVRMCGLVCVVDSSLSPEALESYTRSLTDKLVHRGPDQQDYFGGAGFGLGHTRLSIMDPAGGKQPLISETGASAMVHNGEIYNFRQLRERVQREHADAGRPPYAFSTSSDSEVCLPLFEDHGDGVASMLDGMYTIVVASTDGSKVVAARDPCGIKPLYRGWNADGSRTIFASELKCIVGQTDYVEEFPPGCVWTSGEDGGYKQYFQPEWIKGLEAPLGGDGAAAAARAGYGISSAGAPIPSEAATLPSSGTERVRSLLKAAVHKRLQSDVGYGLLLSGGLDSAIVCSLMSELVDMSQIKSFTVGMEGSPDITAARAVADAFGCIHHEYLFTEEEAWSILPKVIYHLETYEPELIRSSIPNFFLAKLAAQHTKVVLTGEGADELFAGYLYFNDCPDRSKLHGECLRIWDHLHNVNLQRADRMTMAHSLEARVPFLDVEMLREAFEHVDPAVKMHDPSEGRIEKWALRSLFDDTKIPKEVLWRTKAMQCEGVGIDFVGSIQAKCEQVVSDEDLESASTRYPINTPQSKEEYYYRELFEEHFKGMDKFVHVWDGGCRAGGAPWENGQYTRKGLKDVNRLKHGLMEGVENKADTIAAKGLRAKAATPTDRTSGRAGSPRMSLAAVTESSNADEATSDRLAAKLTSGGDSRILLDERERNSYHVPALPLEGSIVRGSCTGSPPTSVGVSAAAACAARLEAFGTDDDEGFRHEVEDVRARLSTAFDLPDGSALVLCASGTCAEYVPMAIARELYPHAPIQSVLAADGETGKGGANACSGKYFDALVPFSGEGEERRQVGKSLGFGDGITLTTLPARTLDGVPVDAASALADSIANGAAGASSEEEAPVWVLRQVACSKTGLATDGLSSVTPEGTDSSRVFEVVDACQLREPPPSIGAHVAEGRMVLLTGSKFFQGSVFSAAVAVPRGVVQRLQQQAPTAPPLPSGLADFLSSYEVPASLAHWRSQLPATRNEGLLLRWQTALPLVEGVAALEPSRRAAIESEWTDRVSGLVEANPSLDVFHSAFGIVSISCALPSSKGWKANKEELRRVHKLLAADLSDAPGASACDASATPIFLGQPVDVSDDFAILRIAMGAELLLDMADGRQLYDLAAQEVAAVAKLGWVVTHFEQLDEWAARREEGVKGLASSVAPAMAQHHGEAKMSLTVVEEEASLAVAQAPFGHCVAAQAKVEEVDDDEGPIGVDVASAQHALLHADAVCFDVDGTVICEEAINGLAEQLGVGEQVRPLTLAAQEGLISFGEAIRRRLDMMQPSIGSLQRYRDTHTGKLTPGVVELIERLRCLGKRIFFVSGGFKQLIEPVAASCRVPMEDVYANVLLFEADGSFKGHDEAQPTSRKGGKAKVVQQLKAKHGYKTVVMIGDGATDMEARDVQGGADAFIGYGGFSVRTCVKHGSCWFVRDFADVNDHLDSAASAGARGGRRPRVGANNGVGRKCR